MSRKKVLMGTSVAYALCWLILFLYYDSLPFIPLLIIFFLMGATGTGGAPIAYTATKELFPEGMAGISIGAVNFFAFLGGVVAQPLIGFILDRAGKIGAHYPSSAYRSVIVVYFIASLLGLITIFFAKETLRKQ